MTDNLSIFINVSLWDAIFFSHFTNFYSIPEKTEKGFDQDFSVEFLICFLAKTPDRNFLYQHYYDNLSPQKYFMTEMERGNLGDNNQLMLQTREE